MRNSSTENCRDLTLKSNTGMASVYSYRNLLRVEQINNLWNTKYWEAHFHHFPPLCYSKCIAKEEWEWNWSLTAVHIFKLYSMYSFTMNWLGTELVWNFLTKVIFFFQEKKKKKVIWKVLCTPVQFLVSDIPSFPSLTRAKRLGNLPGVDFQIQVPRLAASQEWQELTTKVSSLSSTHWSCSILY